MFQKSVAGAQILAGAIAQVFQESWVEQRKLIVYNQASNKYGSLSETAVSKEGKATI